MRPDESGETGFFRNVSETAGAGVPFVERDKNMKKQILVPGLIIGGLMLGSIALANSDNFGIGNHHGDDQHTVNHDMVNTEKRQQNVAARIVQMDAFLDLDEYQKIQVEELLNKYWQDEQVSNGEHGARHDMMHGTEQEASKLRKRLVMRAELRADQIVKQRELQKKFSAIFTEEQRRKAEQTRNSHGQHNTHNTGMHAYGHGV